MSDSKFLRVLLVEDEPALQRALVRLLSAPSVEVLVADSVEHAREVLSKDHAIDLVLSDLNLGAESGFLLAEFVRSSRPALAGRVVLMTADAETGQLDARAEEVGCPLLRKPFAAAEFHALAEQLLQSAPGAELRART